MNDNAREMPRYVSHKTVHALEIAQVGQRMIGSDRHSTQRGITFRDACFEPIDVPEEMFSRYQPVPGDFYVVYADGYKSFSPRKAFLEGYQLDEPNAFELAAAARAINIVT